ncbi:acyltransferase [Candidatus Pacebacteria bacterium]|nr:acyltransferase [Candidatus Paceibacterota bacterium]
MTQPDLTYKPHIDGLRAIAVIAVILFHLNPSLFPGGYLGVDIFFVISGFVITQLLYKDYCKNGTIDIIYFYIRRFKRLYPALLTMVFATTIAYFFFGFLWDTNLYLKSAVSSVFAVSNLYFLFHGVEYFHQDLINPLLHTWSLGVEEQFYVIYPLLLVFFLWIAKKLHLHLAILGSVFLFISILLYGMFYTQSGTIYGDFYFPFARFWELGAGCALFFFALYFPFRFFAGYASVIAAVCIIYVQLFQASIQNVYVETLVTVLATVVIIYSGLQHEGFFIKFLKHAVTTYIGKISYSLYLWHLPVIYFSSLYTNTLQSFTISILGSFLLAVLSYHYIETPLRYSSGFGVTVKRFIPTLPYIAVAVVGAVLIFGQGTIRTSINNGFNKVGVYIKPANYIESNFNLGVRIQSNYTLGGNDVTATCADVGNQGELPRNAYGLYAPCLKQVDGDTLFFLTGDSHALHFLPTLDGSSVIDSLYFVEIPRQSIVNEVPSEYDTEMSARVLQKQKEELQTLSQEFSKIYYVTSFHFSPWRDQIDVIELRLEKYIQTVGPYATLVFIAPTPVFTAGPESCVILGTHCNVSKVHDLERRQPVYDLLKRFEEKYNNVFVYDAYDAICPDDECVIYDRESDFLRYMDWEHLSLEQGLTLIPHFDQWLQRTF